MNKEEVIKYFLDKGILVSPDFFEGDFNSFEFENLLKEGKLSKPLVLNKDLISTDKEIVNSSDSVVVTKQVDEVGSKVKVLFSYDYKNKKKEVKDFVSYFRHRYNSLKKILSSRQELQDSISIGRVYRKQQRERVSLIGVVADKSFTKNDNVKITLEDPTGTFNILVTKNKEDVYNLARDVVLDEVIGVNGTMGNKILFVNGIYFPDIPINHELKKAPDEVYSVFISDIHFGIDNFIKSDFMKFIKWLNCEYGNENQREIAKKVKYLFITGDVVEGVGIYPGQEEDLKVKNIYEQYEEASRYLKMIPDRIKIIICGGNHDAMRMAEPQPVFDKVISKGLYDLPNAVLVSNPSMINIHSSEDFPGFNVLMYHGFSFPYYGDNVPSITEKGGIFRCDLIMKFLLQRRHLAPSHGSTLYVPDETKDPLIITKVPDIFVSGHIHQIIVNNYRNVSMINSSCWLTQSGDQAKRGIVPHPCKIPIINLKTREVKIMNFLDDNVKVLVNERLGLK